jgi:hypothetical protein
MLQAPFNLSGAGACSFSTLSPEFDRYALLLSLFYR